jgi:LPXTG-motif cell wall-anchored protein
MRGPVPNRRRLLLLMAPMVLTLIAIPAGRSDAAEEKVSSATVSEGLKTIQRASEAVVAAGEDRTKAQEAANAITPVWELIETTIKANDNDAYLDFEEALHNISSAALAGDPTQAGEAAGIFGTAAKSYVAKFPERVATAAAATPTPAPARKGDAAGGSAAPAPAPAQAGDAALARTGSTTNALAALAGLALALGGLAVMGGARRPASARVA